MLKKIQANDRGLIISVLIGLAFWIAPAPEGLAPEGWHLLGVFIATIVGIILKAREMSTLVILAITVLGVTKTLPFQTIINGYSTKILWLVLMAFFIAKGFALTGLGARIAYSFTYLLGRKTLGLSYGLLATDLLIAPAIPSATARCGGILYPIAHGIADAFESYPHSESARRLGSFLTLTVFHGTVITSAMFLTAMAANPIIAAYAGKMGVDLTWALWAKAAIVPGLCSLVLMPYVIYKLNPPLLKDTPHAPKIAKEKLKEMGKISFKEGVMIAVLITLVTLWALPNLFGGISSALTAFVGISILLVTRVLHWKNLAKESAAWDTFIWFGGLVVLALELNNQGVITWLTGFILPWFDNMTWQWALVSLGLFYFYIHYLFASGLAHVSALFPAIMGLLIALGAPPMLVVLLLAFSSSLFGGLTHYTFAPAPILFGAGYVPIKTWWKVGFLISVVNILIWLGVGLPWWTYLKLI